MVIIAYHNKENKEMNKIVEFYKYYNSEKKFLNKNWHATDMPLYRHLNNFFENKTILNIFKYKFKTLILKIKILIKSNNENN